MTRTKAERRHHAQRIKASRKTYNAAGDKSPASIGMVARTPCMCSCPLCGNQRERFGQSICEQRNRASHADLEE